MVRGKEVLTYLGRTLNGETLADNHYRKLIAHTLFTLDIAPAVLLAAIGNDYSFAAAGVVLFTEEIRQYWLGAHRASQDRKVKPVPSSFRA